MASNRILRVGPVALTNTLTTNIFNCNVTSLAGPVGFTLMQPYVVFRHFAVVNKTGGAVTVSLWLGATGANAAGTEFLWQGFSVAANSFAERFGLWRFDAADFLVGGASAGTSLTLEMEGEIGIS